MGKVCKADLWVRLSFTLIEWLWNETCRNMKISSLFKGHTDMNLLDAKQEALSHS